MSVETRRLVALLAGLLALAAASTAQAVVFQSGDVFAAIGTGRVQHWRPDGSGGANLLDTLDTTRGGFTTGMAFDSSNRLYVTNFSDRSVSRFDSSGNLLDSQFVTSQSGNNAPESIAFNSAGDFYVGHADGNADIEKFDSAGSFLGSFDVATEDRGSDWIDLAADQNTMFYTSEGLDIKRYDVSTGTQLADFATLSNRPAFALRLLGDGGLLVADSVEIVRLSSTGAVVNTYDVLGHDNWFALNLDPDGTSFWSGDFATGNFHQFDVSTGSLLASVPTGSTQHFGLTVFGEITEATATAPEPITLALMGLGLAGLAFRRRQR